MKTSLKLNSLLLFLARLSAQGVAVLFTVILARKFGVQDFGRFTFLSSMVFVGNTFTNFGTDTFLVRETARAEHVTEEASRSLSLQLLLTIIYCAAMPALHDTALFVYALALFPLAVFSVNNALLRALNRFGIFWFLSLTNGLVQVLAAILSWDVLTLCLFLLSGQILVSILSLFLCRASLPSFRLFPLKGFRPIFQLVLPFAALTLLLVLIQRLGILFSSGLLDEKDTGLFSAVFRVVEGLKLGHYAILGALLPVLSKGRRDSRRSFRRAFFILMFVSFVFTLLLFVFSDPIVSILFGAEFLPASDLLPVLGWGLLPYTVSSFISYDLIARGLENMVVRSAFVSVLVYIILYLILIPHFGLTGVAWSALLGECAQGFVFAVFYLHAFRAGKMVTFDES